MSDLTLYGYAYGDYRCTCTKCSEIFTGDKRAITCLPCALKQRITELEAENKRLREQLDTISGNRGYYTPWEKT